MKRTVNLFNFIFFSVGLAFMIGGISVTVNHANFVKTAETVEARIVEIDTYREEDSDGDYVTRHDVYVSYIFNDIAYDHVEIDYYERSMRRGSTIDILCDPQNPLHVKQNKPVSMMGIGLAAFGLIFFLVGAVSAVNSLAYNLKKKKLQSTGTTIYATITSIALYTNLTVNGVHPYRMVCSYGSYTFESRNLWGDIPSMYQVGDTIEVVVDPADYGQYFINIEE